MKRFVFGFLFGLSAMVGAGWSYFHFGYAPVATDASPMPFEHYLAKMALHARILKEAPKDAPIALSKANLVSGAKLYHDHCLVCHGATTGSKTPIQTGMFPKPPMLLQGKGVTDDPAEESYWKVKNGIRMTGMPGFSPGLTDTELWQVSLLVANADKLPAEAKQYLGQPTAEAGSPVGQYH
jgi:thiosulfate dehydrogenase